MRQVNWGPGDGWLRNLSTHSLEIWQFDYVRRSTPYALIFIVLCIQSNYSEVLCKLNMIWYDIICQFMSNYVKYVSRFKYLGHIVSNGLSDDDEIEREICNMFVRCNTLTPKFSKCSLNVKVTVFRSYCLCLYDIALWNVYKTGSLLKFRSCYQCAKLFFKYRKYDSVTCTCMLLETGLPSFETIISNANHVFNSKWSSCSNVLVTALHRLHLPYYCT